MFGQSSSESSKPSVSESRLLVGSFGKSSFKSETPSPSVSTQPVLSMDELPNVIGQSSASVPFGLSPNPSPSLSRYCVGLSGRSSWLFAHVSPSESRQP